jgi:hypothetical protein
MVWLGMRAQSLRLWLRNVVKKRDRTERFPSSTTVYAIKDKYAFHVREPPLFYELFRKTLAKPISDNLFQKKWAL